jgi:hypothetical protein
MELGDIISFIRGLVTFRNVALGVCCLPLLTMLITLPFFRYFSKSARSWISVVGYLGGAAVGVLAVEAAYRTIASILGYLTQKPQMVFDSKIHAMVQRFEPFDIGPLIYLIVLAGISCLTFVLADVCSTITKSGHWGKKYSEQNPLNLDEK